MHDSSTLTVQSHRNQIYELSPTEQLTITPAIDILDSHLKTTDVFTDATDFKRYCQLKTVLEKEEHFCCLFPDNQHGLIAFEKRFRGTIDGASVHPRVVARRALELNVAAVILAHNHPSGITKTSQADIRFTNRLKDALYAFDIRVLDHIVVGTSDSSSMAEHELL